MTAHAAIAAVPKTAAIDRALLQALLVTRVVYVLGDSDDPGAFDPRGEDGTPVTLVIGYRGQLFWFDEADSTTGHDGTTCIVTSATGGRYKVNNIDLLITSVISKAITTPPDPDDAVEANRPANGDAYIVATASTGAWSGWDGSIAVWVAARTEWFRILPKAGWFVSIAGSTRDTVYRYDSVQEDWITGDGGDPGASSIPLSALKAFGLGPVRVQNQTTYAPPGSRKTGATPTMPLGGTASNINDNDDTTSATTSALGDLSAASVSGRIVAQLTLAATTDLIAIEVRALLGSATSTSNAMGLYYKSGGVWTQAGSGFTLSTSAQTIRRTGSFAAVTDIALVTEAKAWSTNTHTLAGLNAFDATVTVSVGDAYIVAASAFGIFAGKDTQVAICEVADQFSFYAPQTGNKAYDISLAQTVEWNGTAWIPSAGIWVNEKHIFTASGNSTRSGSGFYSGGDTGTPQRSQNGHEDDSIIEFAAKRAGVILRVSYNATFTINTDGTGAFSTPALFRDTDSDALQFEFIKQNGSGRLTISCVFHIETTDDEVHTYRMKILDPDGTSYATNLYRRTFQIEERAAQ